jgi:hypothetical protein
MIIVSTPTFPDASSSASESPFRSPFVGTGLLLFEDAQDAPTVFLGERTARGLLARKTVPVDLIRGADPAVNENSLHIRNLPRTFRLVKRRLFFGFVTGK